MDLCSNWNLMPSNVYSGRFEITLSVILFRVCKFVHSGRNDI